MAKSGPKPKKLCKNGHEIAVVGRDKCRRCKQCLKDAHPLKVGKPRKQFCLRGHDTFITGRSIANGMCIICQKELGKTEKKKAYMKQYVQEHKVEIKEKSRKGRKAWKLLKKYNLTLEDYNRMVIKQKGSCAGCNRHQDEFKNLLSVDHNHKTGKVRGLLCQPCNLVLGNAFDNVKILEQLIKYLKKNI